MIQAFLELLSDTVYSGYYFFLPLGPQCVACVISLLDQTIEPRPSAMKEQRPNHCITREVPDYFFHWGLLSQRETCTTSGPQSLSQDPCPNLRTERIHWRVLSRAVRWGLVFGNWAVARDWFKEQQNSGGVRLSSMRDLLEFLSPVAAPASILLVKKGGLYFFKGFTVS